MPVMYSHNQLSRWLTLPPEASFCFFSEPSVRAVVHRPLTIEGIAFVFFYAGRKEMSAQKRPRPRSHQGIVNRGP